MCFDLQGQTFPAVLNDSTLSGQPASSGQQVILVSHHSQSSNGASDNGYNVSAYVLYVRCAAQDVQGRHSQWWIEQTLKMTTQWFAVMELPIGGNKCLSFDIYTNINGAQGLPGRYKKHIYQSHGNTHHELSTFYTFRNVAQFESSLSHETTVMYCKHKKPVAWK